MRHPSTIILPAAGWNAPFPFLEAVNDNAQHVSLSIPVRPIQEKIVYLYVTLGAGAPGPLTIWLELAPFDVAASYILLGVPTVFAAAGNNIMAWTAHSSFARVIAQIPVGLANAANFWNVQIVYEAKTALT